MPTATQSFATTRNGLAPARVSPSIGRWYLVFARHRSIIATGVIVCALLGVVAGVWVWRSYAASATVIFTRIRPEVLIEPKIRINTTEDGGASAAGGLGAGQRVDLSSRANTLVALGKSPAIAEQVVKDLGSELPEGLRDPSRLAGSVEIRLVPRSEAFEVTARAAQADLAAAIANAWAARFVEHINRLYGSAARSQPGVDAERTSAKAEYDRLQEQLIAFTTTDTLEQLNRQISDKQQMLDVLANARKEAISAAVSKETEGRSAMLSAYLAADANVELTVFKKEQAAKMAVFDTYLDELAGGRQEVFQSEYGAVRQRLKNNYALRLQLDRLDQDARALLTQLENSTGDSATNDLTITLLKAQVFAAGTGLPANLQLNLGAPGSGGARTTRAEETREVRTLVASIQSKTKQVEADIQRDASSLVSGSLVVRGLEAAGTNVLANSSDVEARALKLYNELTTLGPLTRATRATGQQDSELRREARARALQLGGQLDTITAFSAPDSPFLQSMDKIQAELRNLAAEKERLLGRRQALVQARDLAMEKFTLASRKAAELALSSGLESAEVSVGSAATVPARSQALQAIAFALGGAVAGLVFSLLGVVAMEFLRSVRETARRLDHAESIEPVAAPG